jgi:hypothetical protein
LSLFINFLTGENHTKKAEQIEVKEERKKKRKINRNNLGRKKGKRKAIG